MKPVCISGVVSSGKGEGADFVKLPWVRRQIAEKLGFDPYNGTLNLKPSEVGRLKIREMLGKARAIQIVPAKGFSRGRCFKACLSGNVQCAVVIPEIVGYPEDIIELVAPVNLREKLQLKDGDKVDFTILL